MMKKAVRDMIMRRRRRDYADYDMEDRDYRDRGRDYEDGRRGVKGTGRYGIGGSRYYDRGMRDEDYRRDRDYGDYNDYNDYEDMRRDRRDYNDYDDYRRNRDYRDYADGEMKLTSSDMRKWKNEMENSDGTMGERFQKAEIEQMAEQVGAKMNNYDEKELCLTANMLYSDYGKTLKQYIPQEKESMIYTKLAKDFLEDKDAAVKGGEKLATYYYTIVDNE